MPVYTNKQPSTRPTHGRVASLFAIYLLLPGLVMASGFSVRSVETHLQNEVYKLDSQLELAFSEEAEKALRSGIPIIILMDIEVEELRSWWWNKTVSELQQGYLVLYHALTEKYIVNNLNNSEQHDYTSLSACLTALSQIKDLTLVQAASLEKNKLYQLRMKVRLDIESLPAPMRPLAYVSSDWQLASDWYTWPLQQ